MTEQDSELSQAEIDEEDEYARADPGPSPEEEIFIKRQEIYYRRLRARLGEPTAKTVVQLAQLLARAGRYMRLSELRAPSVVLDKEGDLVRRSLDRLDPLWRTHGLSPEDWAAYQAATDQRNAVLYDNLARDRATRASSDKPV